MRRSPYLILAPIYRDDSAGIRVLYALRQHLEARGYQAACVQGGTAPVESVVVYPESVSGNPLHGQTVVRYILNHPGTYGISMEAGPHDLLFTCNKAALRQYVSADDRVLCIPIIEEFFKDEHLPRAGACFYVGKSAGTTQSIDTAGMTEIIGMTRAQVAQTLKTSEILYSFDNFSMIAHEARACGCPVVVIGSTVEEPPYADHVRDFPAQLDTFIRITQEAAEKVPIIAFGVMVNDVVRLDMVLRQSQIQGEMHFVKEPASATKGLNILLDQIEATGAGVAALVHQDMYFRQGWLPQVQDQIAKLPEAWIVAGVIGKDARGRICGKFRDMRIPGAFDTSFLHMFPHPAVCMDECVILVNIKTGFRFDETLDGFDLYGTLCVLQTWERGGTAWILDAPAEHYCLRPFTWIPDEAFCKRFQWLSARFEALEKLGKRIDTTAVGVEAKEDRIFATSAA